MGFPQTEIQKKYIWNISDTSYIPFEIKEIHIKSVKILKKYASENINQN